MHTHTFCKYRKKLLASPRVHLVFVTKNYLMLSLAMSVRPSSVEISLERGSKRSAEPIDLKIGLSMDN